MKSKTEPIAIIGSSCRFPGSANSPSKLWELLRYPKDVLMRIPPTRFNPDGFYHKDGEHHGSTNVTHSYLLDEDYRVFDHEFFGIHPKEVESMDPQQRILLETVYEGIESAGYSKEKLRGSSTAVFVGQMSDDYHDMLLRDIDNLPQYTGTGISRAIMANRISYFFDWRGPSLNIDTACSSSLVALHQAVQTLRRGESDLAVVAGVNLILGPESYITESKLHMLSPTGRSRMWDSSADGYARGEGFAAVILKPLKKAIADSDHIECIVKETGVNQDGRSTGLTVPNAVSQTALIRSTYENCGLDCEKNKDRCQYFEAHGTGTLAGDPKEAEAIRDAFFPSTRTGEPENGAEVLYVGSVKTVIGHLEGTAGLAGLLKASLAIQHGQIPPNMHFNQLNPAIEPFYQNFSVPVKLRPWPTLAEGTPRRASINSFGFGGTNAHVIIESWEADSDASEPMVGQSLDLSRNSRPLWGPITLSANSEHSLRGMMRSLSLSLTESNHIDPSNMTWTLQSRRSEFRFRAAFSAIDVDQLAIKLDNISQEETATSVSTKSIQVSQKFPVRLLGIFTGQGAQWPTMGLELYKQSQSFRDTIQLLQKSLETIVDAPQWSLAEELLHPTHISRVHMAEVCQPLTTAVQIALIDLLWAAGISFSAVVGHSSGEIAAAYAADYLTASDAIRIAYYRGLHTKLARSKETRPGGMLAVGMSFEDAERVCQRDQFRGRLKVAASNSRSSATLSGDRDAIDEAKAVLSDKKNFARILRIDAAYHSHHVQHCYEPYLNALRHCNIRPRRTSARGPCNWYSSVLGLDGTCDYGALTGIYWAENMIKPVLFSQALDRAIKEENCFDLALEIGPHPVLKGPTLDTFKVLTGIHIPYQGVLKRGENDMLAFTDTLGFIWKHIQSPAPIINFEAAQAACTPSGSYRRRVEKGLPPYHWDHTKPFLKESRKSKMWRTRRGPIHDLLGTISSSNSHEVRWRNIMKLSEMDWLRGHRFQGQVLFPATGYVSMAYDAIIHIVGNQLINLVELQDLAFHRAIVLEEDSRGVDVTFVIKVTDRNSAQITMEYSCYSADVDATVQDNDNTEYRAFTGRAKATMGAPMPTALPSRISSNLPMAKVDVGRFYSWASTIGLQYSGNFCVDSIKRRLDIATVVVKRTDQCGFHVHPATLDASFHGLFAAYSFPGDRKMWAPYLPTRIKKIRINTACYQARQCPQPYLAADCYIREGSLATLCGDVDIFCLKHDHPEIQVQGITCSSFTTPSPENDRKLFARTIWKKEALSGLEWHNLPNDPPSNRELFDICERTAYFYMRRLCQEVSKDEIPSFDVHSQYLMDWVLNHLLPRVNLGQHPYVKPEWSTDTYKTIENFTERFPEQIDLKIMHTIGRAFPSIVRGTVPALQLLMENDVLHREYQEGLGFSEANNRLGMIASQLSHQFPRMRVLEIGAGTGGATEVALRSLGTNFESYTFTDISPGFFEKAQLKFTEHGGNLRYHVLDIERPPGEQGIEEHSFDLVIASNVLHATTSLSNTINNCRQLLRPGGHMLLLEITAETLHTQFIVCGLPGWWLGRNDGRVYCPTVSEAQWNSVLRSHGFSGVDNTYWDTGDRSYHTFSVMITQALDPRIEILRQPLIAAEKMPQIPNLVIVGGKTALVSNGASKISRILGSFARNTKLVNDIEDVRVTTLEPGSVVLCISDLAKPAFKRLNMRTLEAIQHTFGNASHVLWATTGCRTEDPYANMMVGLGRSASLEYPLTRIQLVDISCLENADVWTALLSQILLRAVYIDIHKYKDILWSIETEMVISDGDVYIPRVVPDHALNFRLNSERRPIQNNVSLESTPVAAANRDAVLILEQDSNANCPSQGYVKIRVHSSSVFAYSASKSHPMYLCLGTLSSENQKVLAISPRSASIIQVPPNQTFQCEHGLKDHEILEKALKVLLAESFFEGLTGTLWVHDADTQLAELVSMIAKRQGLSLFLSTSAPNKGGVATFIHSNISQRALEHLIPAGTQRFINMAEEHSGDLEDSIPISRRGYLDMYRPNKETQTSQIMRLLFDNSRLRHIIAREADLLGLSCMLRTASQQKPLEISAFPAPLQNQCCTSVINWQTLESVSAQILPLNTCSIFSDKKTYFLVGMAGDLGMSLVEWMTDHGARYFAIASRNPVINPELLSHLHKKGTNIRLFPLDTGDKTALSEVYSDIVSTMPPIAGVANAAMVLRDKPLSNMSIDDFNVVLRPKVDGSKNLDELFYNDELEFFILFSSMASVVGNPAQSNYGAANMFMSTLAAQRRQRGVAASVISIAMLLGIGYIAQSLNTDSTVESQMRKFSYLAMSESEFHSLFAEAVQSGRPDSREDPELLTGFDNNQDAPWREMARFSHFYKGNSTPHKKQQRVHPTELLQTQLKNSQDRKSALQLLETALSSKLELVLQVTAEKIDKDTSLMELGIDSLVAVEIRSWLLKELGVDMPVFKLLSGTTLTDICRDALTKVVGLSTVAANGGSNTSEVSNQPPQSLLVVPFRGRTERAYEAAKIVTPEQFQNKDEITAAANSGDLPRNLGHKYSSESQYERIGEMSHAQARLYFLCEYLEDKSTHNVGYIGRHEGYLNIARLKNAVHEVYTQHESLRSSYFIDVSSGLPVQAVNPTPHNTFEHKTIDDDSGVYAEVELLKRFTFKIELGSIMKVVVLSRSPELQYILFFHHHIALDGVSWLAFIGHLSRVYSGGHGRYPIQQATDLSTRSRLACTAPSLQKELTFWKEMHQNRIPPLPLFAFAKVNCRKTLKQYDTETFSDELSMSLVNLIRQRAAKLRITLFHFFLSTFAVFLARCLDVKSLGIGIIDANRREVRDQETVGCFLNVLPLHFRLEHHDHFEDIATRTRDTVLAALGNSKAPFDAILDYLQVPRSAEYHPLFQVLLNYRNGYATETPFDNGSIHWIDGVASRNPYDIAVDITETTGRTLIHVTTQKYLYNSPDSKSLMKWYIRALEGLAYHPQTPVSACPLSNAADVRHMISLGRGASVDTRWNGTIIDRIEEMAKVYPDSPALKDDYARALTYFEMMNRANVIAAHLSGIPLVHGSPVAMLLDPMTDHVCCLLAVMKLGLIWVPLDLRNHYKRLSAMVTDSRPVVLVCNNDTLAQACQLAQDQALVVNLDDLDFSQQTEIENFSRLDQPAIILYTSGSTGVPKGVLLSHQNILYSIFTSTQHYKLGREIVLQQSALGFDLSLDQTFHALANGGTLIIVGKDGRGDPIHLAKLMWSQNVTYTIFVTSEYLSVLNYGFQVLKQCTSWRFAVSLGEKMTSQLRRGIQRLNLEELQLINAYGPTEGTIACSRGLVPYRTEEDIYAQSDCLLPMPGYLVVIMDEQMDILPVGYPGEICISGPGLAIGYLNRPSETDRAFVEIDIEPISEGQAPRRRFYRTGDSGRILEDGSLHVLGRIKGDSQVKIHGIRVELNEVVKAVIESAPDIVANATVSYRQEVDILVAFVVLDTTFLGNKVEFAEGLRAKVPLPPYMCPSVVVAVDEIPMNINGKQDRTAIDRLPIPVAIQRDDFPSKHLTRTEQQLKEIWKEILPSRQALVSHITSNTDFFHAGGNSMLVIKLRMLLRRTFGVELSLPELFQLSTLYDMAVRVEAHYHASPIKSIDWNAEVATLCHGLPQPQDYTPYLQVRTPKTVLLTGATGFLGTRILQRLVDNKIVGSVHCVAIRGTNAGEDRHVSVQSSKIIEYTGDLSSHHLGLSEEKFGFLAEHLDLIIHNGAEVSYLKTYHSLRSANVISTRILIELAIPRRVPLHFVSTAAVASITSQSSVLPEVSVSLHAPSLNTQDGYAVSKWVSELLLEKAALEYSIPTCIHRPTTIVGPGAPELDLMTAIIKYSRLLRSVPGVDSFEIKGMFDLVEIEDVSHDLVNRALDTRTSQGKSLLRFVHHCTERKIAPDGLKEYFELMDGVDYEVLSIQDWLQAASVKGLNPLVVEYIHSIVSSKRQVELPMIMKGRE